MGFGGIEGEALDDRTKVSEVTPSTGGLESDTVSGGHGADFVRDLAGYGDKAHRWQCGESVEVEDRGRGKVSSAPAAASPVSCLASSTRKTKGSVSGCAPPRRRSSSMASVGVPVVIGHVAGEPVELGRGEHYRPPVGGRREGGDGDQSQSCPAAVVSVSYKTGSGCAHIVWNVYPNSVLMGDTARLLSALSSFAVLFSPGRPGHGECVCPG